MLEVASCPPCGSVRARPANAGVAQGPACHAGGWTFTNVKSREPVTYAGKRSLSDIHCCLPCRSSGGVCHAEPYCQFSPRKLETTVACHAGTVEASATQSLPESEWFNFCQTNCKRAPHQGPARARSVIFFGVPDCHFEDLMTLYPLTATVKSIVSDRVYMLNCTASSTSILTSITVLVPTSCAMPFSVVVSVSIFMSSRMPLFTFLYMLVPVIMSAFTCVCSRLCV